MKRTIALATASFIAAAGFAAPSLAQDTTAPAIAPSTGSEGTTTMSLDTGTTASTTGEATFSDVVAAIGASATSADQIGTITDVSKVKIVKVSDLATGDEATQLQTAMTENQADVTKLQSAVEANAALKAELDKQQVKASSVVATKMEADGAVTVFVQ